MEHMPSIFVILVNWNRPQDTLECIRSIQLSDCPNVTTVVVDNGSKDDSLSLLKQVGDKIVLIESDQNLGFTGGNNLGIKYAMEQNADYVFLFNNDALIAPDALSKMMAVAEGDKKVGMVAPKILYHPERGRIWSAGTKYYEWCMTTRLTGYTQVDVGQYDDECDLPFAVGCAMLIKKELLNKIGLLVDEIFATGEDVDYGLRTLEQGYRIRYVPSAVAWHKESVSSGGKDAPQYVYYQTRNMILIQRLWAKNFLHLALAHFIASLHLGKRVVLFSIKGKWRSILGLLYGVCDGFTGRLGKREYAVLTTDSRSR